MEATGGGNLQVGSQVSNTGLIEALAGSTVSLSNGGNNLGTIEANGGNVYISGNESGGNAVIANGTLEFAASSNANVFFAAPTGTLALDTSQFGGRIFGFGAQDALDLRNINFSANPTLSYTANFDGSGGTLAVSDGSHTDFITLVGQYSQLSFQGAGDNGTG